MSGANVGGNDIVQSGGSREAHMRDFDALPGRIRRFLVGMSINWNGSDVLGVCREHGESVTLHLLEKTEAQFQEAMRQKTAA